MRARKARAERRRRQAQRRPWLGTLALMLGLGGLSLIGSYSLERDEPEVEAREPSPSARVLAEAPIRAEAVTLALNQLPRKFDPLDDMEPWAERIADDLVFEGLVRRSPHAHPWIEPGISDRCETNATYSVVTVICHIPEGIRFHDGSELSVDDVIYSLRQWLLTKNRWIRQQQGLATFARVEVVDGPPGARDPGRWVRLGFTKPEPLALEALAAVKIVPEHAHRGRTVEFSQAPIGTGPMRMTSMEADRIVLERVEDFRDPARRASTHRIVFRAINDGADALAALRRGELHLLPELSPRHVPVELGEPGMLGRFDAYLVSPARYDLLLWNLDRGLSADDSLRRALHEALPLAAIARDVYGSPSLALEAPLDLHEPTPIDLEALVDIKPGEAVRGGLLPLRSREDDLAGAQRAAAKLDILDWPVGNQGMRRRPGGPLRVTLAWDGHTGRPSLTAGLIRRAWKQIGVWSSDTSTTWRFLLGVLEKGEFRVALLHFGGHSDEDLYHLFHTRGALNIGEVSDRELDRALIAYRKAQDRSARELAKRNIAARIAELRAVSLLHAPTHVTLASRRLGPIEFIDDLPRLDTLALSPDEIDWGHEASR